MLAAANHSGKTWDQGTESLLIRDRRFFEIGQFFCQEFSNELQTLGVADFLLVGFGDKKHVENLIEVCRDLGQNYSTAMALPPSLIPDPLSSTV